MRYFIPEVVRIQNNFRYLDDPFHKSSPKVGSIITLYSKNSNSISEWMVVEICHDKFGCIAERDTCPTYWARVIKEVI